MCDHPNREEAMVVVERDPSGKPTVWCDPCLVDLIAALNDTGLPTVASCCGHHRQAGIISLRDGRHLIITADMAEALDVVRASKRADRTVRPA